MLEKDGDWMELDIAAIILIMLILLNFLSLVIALIKEQP